MKLLIEKLHARDRKPAGKGHRLRHGDPPGENKQARTTYDGDRRSGAESSISLRVITSAMAIVGILAASQMAESPPQLMLFGILGTAVGSVVSYRRRNANNFWIKWALAAGILVVLGFFIEEILYRIQATIADARAPLTNMLVALQALHSFDLPRRRDLNISALVGLTLMASAATLSRDLIYGVYLMTFICFGSYMLMLDSASRTAQGTAEIRVGESSSTAKNSTLIKTRLAVALLVILTPVISLFVFLATPKMDIGLLGKVRVSLKLNLPFLTGNKIDNPLLHSAKRSDGSLVVNPEAYHGFSENLDLNYRGELGDQIVLKVACPKGEFWRAMAFDTYDGHQWKMSKPRKTYDRLTIYGAAIQLAPLPSLVTPRRVPVEELGQVFYLEQDQPNLIAAAAVPTLIYFPTNKVQVDTYGSLRSPVLMEKDMVYTVFSQVPRYDLSIMRKQPPLDEDVLERVRKTHEQYLQLPENLPDAIKQLGDSIAGEEDNWFNKAEQINLYLQRNYRYKFDLPPTPEKEDCAADFLFNRRAGYCEHFSTAFVILCRCEGIPARLVTGFRPGEYNPFTGLWDVRMRDAHAWAEVFLPRWGWVPFDPTPDGAPPGLGANNQRVEFEFLVKRMAELWDKLAKHLPVKRILSSLSVFLAPLAGAVSGLFILLDAFWQPAAVTMGVIALALLAAGFLKSFAAGRRSRQDNSSSRARITTSFLDLCQALKTIAIERQPDETAERLAGRVGDRLRQLGDDSDLADSIRLFLESYSRARFGPAAHEGDLVQLAARLRERLRLLRSS